MVSAIQLFPSSLPRRHYHFVLVFCPNPINDAVIYLVKLTLELGDICLAVMFLLNLDSILLNEVANLILGQGLLVRFLEPVGEAEPFVLTGLEPAFLLQHLEPLLRSGLFHLDLFKSSICVGDESVLGLVGFAETSILGCIVSFPIGFGILPLVSINPCYVGDGNSL